ncbi:N-acetyltransferase [Actinoplanes sp. L3-i22]|uniref:GNAT family N-acetyltransferase n=1 Tax=Actinoplanes sp. L3-i22 TaxID=2836373 RepID=UPI001C8534B5|nr:GNAT family N-acetyltransferase [Actinoplanes sp. L3-i22]
MEISISKAGVEIVDRLEPLWLSLHEHHQKVVPDAVYQPRDASWTARRSAYVEWLASPGSFVLLAEAEPSEGVAPEAKPDGEAMPDRAVTPRAGLPQGDHRSAPAGNALVGNALVGYALVQVRPGPDDTWVTGNRMAELQTLSVAPGARGQGIGTRLLDRVDAELDAAGIGDLFIAALHGNDDAIRLYQRRGLRPVAIHLARFAADQRPE